MSDKQSEHPIRDGLVHAYDRMLERVRHGVEVAEEKTGPTLEQAIEDARHKAVELGEATREEAHDLAEYIRRDLHDIGDYLNESSRDFRTWFRMDLQLVEARILDLLSSIADRTRVELAELEARARAVGIWHTGEVAAPGVLVCQHCDTELHFTRSGRIPPCPKCHGTTYRRDRD
ncbi:Zinc-ribbon containing domain-containing protein [Ectothiorhodospira magna]|uniref:Zinc-ribbon containing domain-containing protein n=1 Tax=Ectothiorhodospira magna TaxID=867345 RepID=A0A1H9EBE2_9GAMM|nr:zinc ribbon-containing protein [Ectothiorhodospira magna]SEQ22949.1 Zinc-ribbon containing domain-containing protein [Ectothiorhodospira magna]